MKLPGVAATEARRDVDTDNPANRQNIGIVDNMMNTFIHGCRTGRNAIARTASAACRDDGAFSRAAVAGFPVAGFFTGDLGRLARGVLAALAIVLSSPLTDAQARGGGREFLAVTFTPVVVDLWHDGCRNGVVLAAFDASCTSAAILGDAGFVYRGRMLRFAKIEHNPREPGADPDLEVAFEPVGSDGSADIGLDDGLMLTVNGQSFALDRRSASVSESGATASSFRWPVSGTLFRSGRSVPLTMTFSRSGISVSPVRPVVSEGEPAAFTLTRGSDSTGALEVSVVVTDADGVLASQAPSSVTFEADAATATLRLATRDNEAAQADAAVTLALQPGHGWQLGMPSQATVTVRDDDPHNVTVAATPGSVVRGDDAVFTLTRVGNLSEPLTVDATLTDGTQSPPVATPVIATFGTGRPRPCCAWPRRRRKMRRPTPR